MKEVVFEGRFRCPNCNSEMEFSNSLDKHRCPKCNRIWTFTFESGRMIAHEWFESKAYEWPKLNSSVTYYDLKEGGTTAETVDELKKLLKLDL